MSTASRAPENDDTIPRFSKAEPTLLGMPHEIQLKILCLVLPAAVLEVSVPEWPSLFARFAGTDSDKDSPTYTIRRPRGSEAVLLTCNELFEMGIRVVYEELIMIIPLVFDCGRAEAAAWCDKMPISLRKRVTKVVLEPDGGLAKRYAFQLNERSVELIDLSPLTALREVELIATCHSEQCEIMIAFGTFDEQTIRMEIVHNVLCGPIETFLDSVQCRPGVKLSGEVIVNIPARMSTPPFRTNQEKFATLNLGTNRVIKHEVAQ